jgi:ribosome-associated protein
MAATGDDGLEVTPALTIPETELVWRFTGSGGPGGQHANTANTRVELVFDVAGSPTLADHQRARLLERLGPAVRVVASDERSQYRNRSLARARLAARLRAGLAVAPVRRPTRPGKGAVERRLAAKRRQSDRKRQRRARPPDD